jgi:hypothetical protein
MNEPTPELRATVTHCIYVNPNTGEACTKKVIAKQRCLTHYQALRRFEMGKGRDPSIPKEDHGPLVQVASKVDDETYEALMGVVIPNDSSVFEVTRQILKAWAKAKRSGELGPGWP